MDTQKILSIVAFGVIVAVGAGLQPKIAEWRVNSLESVTGAEQRRTSHSTANPDEVRHRIQSFNALWLSRNKPASVRSIALLLKGRDSNIQRAAIKALGRIENPEYISELKALHNADKSSKEQAMNGAGDIQFPTLALAIARIESKQLKGSRKIDLICKSVGLTFSDVILVSQQANGKTRKKGRAANEILNEIVDVLYSEGKRGVDVSMMVPRLLLSPIQKLKLNGIKQTQVQEIDAQLEYFSHLRIGATPHEYLHLLGLGPTVNEKVLAKLRDMSLHPTKYKERNGYVDMFFIAAALKEKRAAPLVKSFEKNANPAIRSYAKSAHQIIISGTGLPVMFP
jgi:hypothetical protein